MYWRSIGNTIVYFVLSKSTHQRNIQYLLSANTIEADRYNDLLNWLKDNNAEVNEKIEIRESTMGCGYGAFVKSSVEEGDLLFTVPRKACLTLEDATSDIECGENFKKLMDKVGPG